MLESLPVKILIVNNWGNGVEVTEGHILTPEVSHKHCTLSQAPEHSFPTWVRLSPWDCSLLIVHVVLFLLLQHHQICPSVMF